MKFCKSFAEFGSSQWNQEHNMSFIGHNCSNKKITSKKMWKAPNDERIDDKMKTPDKKWPAPFSSWTKLAFIHFKRLKHSTNQTWKICSKLRNLLVKMNESLISTYKVFNRFKIVHGKQRLTVIFYFHFFVHFPHYLKKNCDARHPTISSVP